MPLIKYFRSWLNVLLLALPVVVGMHMLHFSPALQFLFACAAIVPLAGLMGHATEDLADRAGSGVGGLLNATFGNAAELIIAIVALQKGLVDVVKASLTGSIVGNLLFVMGLSCLAGGLRYRKQTFDKTAASAGVTMMAVALIGLLVPATYHHLVGKNVPSYRLPSLETMSLVIAGVLLLNYALGLVFSLKTHKQHYNPELAEKSTRTPTHTRMKLLSEEKSRENNEDEDHPFGVEDYLSGGGQSVARARAEHPNKAEFDEASTKQRPKPAPRATPHHPQPLWAPIVVLLLATIGVVIASEILVGAIEPVMEKLELRELFVGAVIIAIIGNAAEHSTAVLMALRNKMDLAMQICIGSSLQIALFVTPVLVFLSALMGRPMDLEFTSIEILAILACTFVVFCVSADGESNWFEGVQLLTLYALLAVAFFFIPNPHPTHPKNPAELGAVPVMEVPPAEGETLTTHSLTGGQK